MKDFSGVARLKEAAAGGRAKLPKVGRGFRARGEIPGEINRKIPTRRRLNSDVRDYFMEAVMEQNLRQNARGSKNCAFGEKIGLVGKLFGCWHKNLTRPFTAACGGESYRACVECGARRRFDAQNLKTFGAFYYPPAISLVHPKR